MENSIGVLMIGGFIVLLIGVFVSPIISVIGIVMVVTGAFMARLNE